MWDVAHAFWLNLKWSYLEVHSPVRDKGEEDWEDFHQSFHLLYLLFWKFPSVGHFGAV